MLKLAVVELGKMGLSHHAMINAHPRVQAAAYDATGANAVAREPVGSEGKG